MRIIKTSTLLSALIGALASAPATANVNVNIPGFDGGDNSVGIGETITASSISGVKDSYANDPVYYSAQGNQGHWFNFVVTDTADVSINVSTIAGTGTFSPGMTVWSSGINPFTGGSTFVHGETSSVTGHSTPTSFNALSPINSPPVTGTRWMAQGYGGNLQNTLAYAMAGPTLSREIPGSGGGGGGFSTSGFGGGLIDICNTVVCDEFGNPIFTPDPTPSYTSQGAWGENIIHGVHNVESQHHSSSFSGFASGDSAELVFNDLQPGWYTAFVGGSDTTDFGAQYNLTISAVPEMETWAMMLAGMGLLGWRLKKQQAEATELAA